MTLTNFLFRAPTMADQRSYTRLSTVISLLIAAGLYASDVQAGPMADLQLTALIFYAIAHPIETLKEISKAPEEKRKLELRRLAIEQCETEARTLPEAFDIDEFVDEGASLRTTLLMKLLIDRQVRAIYVRPIKQHNVWRLAHSDGGSGPNWHISEGTQGYVKLAFGYRTSGKCLHEGQMPISQERKFDQPPFLMDSCITATYVDKPSARYALRYVPSEKALGMTQMGYWTITDLELNRSIAQLITVDDPTTPSSENYQDCRSPYSFLADRIKPQSNSEPRPITARNTTVTPNIFPSEIEVAFGTVPSIVPIISNATFSSDEEDYLFNWHFSTKAWRKAIAEAKKEKIGHYGERLFDFDRQELKSLKTSPDNRYGWKVTALQKGFLVFPAFWKRGESNLLARYDTQGKLEWAVKVVDSFEGCSLGPSSASVTVAADSIILHGRCKERHGTSWAIKKSSIFPMKLP